MKKRKTPKILKAPKWKDALSPKQITEAEHLLCVTLAGTFRNLASMIEEADFALGNADNIPQGTNIVEIQNNGPLFAIDDIGGENRDWVMKQSLLTYLPVMRALYSTVKLKREIEDAIGVKDAAKFYEDLKVALRFYDKYEHVGGSHMSGDDHHDRANKKVNLLGTFYLGEHMNAHLGGPTTRDLIARVLQWRGQTGKENLIAGGLTSLTDFINKNCVETECVESKVKHIHLFVRKNKLPDLPCPKNNPKDNQTKLYDEIELKEVWPKLKLVMPKLPNLKAEK